MSNTLRIALATAAVVIVSILGIRFLGGGTNFGGPSETATPSPMPSPSALPVSGELDPGRYLMTDRQGAPVPFAFTVPAGWSINGDGFIVKHEDAAGELSLAAWDITHVFGHACTRPDGDEADLIEVGPTVDDLAYALAGQEERQTSGPGDAKIGGRPGQLVEFTAPTDAEMAACGGEFMRIWAGTGGALNSGWRSVEGQTDRVYVFDVGGDRVVINTWHFTDTSEADLAELETILASIRFEP